MILLMRELCSYKHSLYNDPVFFQHIDPPFPLVKAVVIVCAISKSILISISFNISFKDTLNLSSPSPWLAAFSQPHFVFQPPLSSLDPPSHPL